MKKWMGRFVGRRRVCVLACGRRQYAHLGGGSHQVACSDRRCAGGILFQTVERFANHVDSMSGGRAEDRSASGRSRRRILRDHGCR